MTTLHAPIKSEDSERDRLAASPSQQTSKYGGLQQPPRERIDKICGFTVKGR
ncbi:MAG: hypothetical protein F6K04_15680 [Leptolyngbya sp. SIO4C5]|nr:hypothetical protein [Leptolyngbya sp. SIO4C5]